MSENDDLVLAELLCARLCHDLAGAVGAVGTGAELLADEAGLGEMAEEALALLSSSAAAAVNRLRFLRLALGSGASAMRAAELRDLATNFVTAAVPGADTVRLDWPTANGEICPPRQGKLLLNLILLARDGLPRGGVIGVHPQSLVEARVTVTAEGARASLAEISKGLAADSVADLGPREAQGYYAARLAKCLGLTINYKDSHDCVILTAEKN